MSKYGKHCKKDSDCPSKICEMTYFKNNKKKPDSRKCVNPSYKSLNMENNVVVIDNTNNSTTSTTSDTYNQQELSSDDKESSGSWWSRVDLTPWN